MMWKTSAGILTGLLLLAGCTGEGSESADLESDSEETADADEQTDDEGGDDEQIDDDQTDSEESGGFFAGKTVTILAAASPGGGADATSNFVADLLRENLDGSPDVVVEFVPGGGTLTGSNEYELRREHDGTNLLITFPSNQIPWILGQPNVEYDLGSYEPLIGFPNGGVVYVRESTGVEAPEDITSPAEPLIYGATGPTGLGALNVLAFEALGVREDVDQVFGYEGGGAIRLAFEQGEINTAIETTTAFLSGTAELVDAGEASVAFTFGYPDSSGQLGRDPALPDAPSLREAYVANYGSEPEGEQAYETFASLLRAGASGFSITMHGDAPSEAIDELRAALETATQASDYAERAEPLVGPFAPIVGSDLQNLTDGLRSIDPENIQWFKQFLTDEYQVEGLDP